MSDSHGGSWSFILVAGGSGSRMKRAGAEGNTPKQFRTLGDRPMWAWSARVAERLCKRGKVDELIVILPQSFMELSEEFHFDGCVKFVVGGVTRTDSVVAGLKAACGDFVLIHDAARPFLTEELCLAAMEATGKERGAVPLLASVDSLKSVDGDVVGVLDRESIYRTQTPQSFPRTMLLDAIASYEGSATDEATVWLAASRDLSHVDGEEGNFKITTDYDWQVACALSATREIRTGFGFDVHELVPGRPLVLGGIVLESPLGLLGHSDADIVTHAISDALLGAAGEGDIGTLFPASDERFCGIDSTILLERILSLIREKGWKIVWLDVTLVAQIPRLGHKMTKISDNLCGIFTRNGEEAKLSLKVKSGEWVGSIGRAECMTCYATATLERFSGRTTR